ncbi:integrase zinc binding domain-containing protein, partial [Streptococcus dysgalactiae]|uniref:integrase zinc binding domain-containing protein n=1 Tax=Streptococcus dysgalactiae TaxID=1334 RepID=UPI00195208D8
QKEVFSEEISILKGEETQKARRSMKLRSSRLRKLSPFLSDGIIRVGGRLTYLPLPFDVKHPILMPNKHYVTRLLILHYHTMNGHVGIQHTLCDIQRKYWIIGGFAAVRGVLSRCASCRIRNARPMQQIMAPVIPDQYAVFQPAFTAVGVDYFGLLLVARGRVREKRYGCLFTCLTTTAVHIEVSPLLDTDSFLCAFSRFAARRGWPSRVYSDNGQNFRGAEVELKCHLEKWNQQKITEIARNKECDWVFNPPCASHRGGLWERLIRSIRQLLGGILNNQIVNDDVLLTTLIEVERILNNRPLIPAPDSPDPYATLSPRELLSLCSTEQLRNENSSLPVRLSRRWRQVQHLRDSF